MWNSNAAVFHWRVEEARNRRAEMYTGLYINIIIIIYANYAPQVRHFTPVRCHAVRYHMPWFELPDTACWTYKRQYGSSGKLKKHVDEERIKSDLDSHVDQEPHQM